VYQEWQGIWYMMVLGDVLGLQTFVGTQGLESDGRTRVYGMLSTEVLRELSRGKLNRYLAHSSDESDGYAHDVARLWQALLETMLNPSIVDEHYVTVCNAICVFLQSASASRNLIAQRFATSKDTWMAIFEALLHRFDTGKLKASRQVLNTLIKILNQHRDDDSIRVSIQDVVLSRLAEIILLRFPIPYFRASMAIFEALMRSTVPTSRVLSAIGRCHGSSLEAWNREMRRRAIDVDELRSTAIHNGVDESIFNFSFSVLLAVSDSSIQATAGTFFLGLVAVLSDFSVFPLPLWVEQISIILCRYPRTIGAFRNHLLPTLFKLHPDGFDFLLQGLIAMHRNSLVLENILTIAVLGADSGLWASGGTSSP
jgi:hypothetical protein